MDTIQWIVFAVFVVVVMAYVYIDTTRKNKARMLKRLKDSWGNMPEKDYLFDEFENIAHYFRNSEKNGKSIDDITWNDLDMDRIFKMMNNTHSSVGQEYLYKILRTPETNEKELKERDRLATFFAGHEKERIDVQKIFMNMGYASYVSVTDYIDLIVELKSGNNFFHYVVNVLFFGALLFCFRFNAQIGILAVIAATAVCVISYYKQKAKIERYFICVKHIVKMVLCAKELAGLRLPELEDYNRQLNDLCKVFEKFVSNSAVLSSGNDMNGSLAQIASDYIRMITHMDLIKFNNMIELLNNHTEDVYRLIDALGRIEASIAIASFREMLPYWCVPKLGTSHVHLDVDAVYHPLISAPVANSIHQNKSVLLTGSNASGKSTFLKTVAINALLSQTIYTSVSENYNASYFRIFSSMALKDDLSNNESYYIVEIKTLKKILENIDSDSSIPVLCFVDEVLRGTNTVERISASSQILYSLCQKNVLCFAATHDIELTSILETYYANYHFQETVTDDDITFNYTLFKGRATSRNAIKLLGVIGYDKKIVEKSEEMAAYFMNNGKWMQL